jgi:transposase
MKYKTHKKLKKLLESKLESETLVLEKLIIDDTKNLDDLEDSIEEICKLNSKLKFLDSLFRKESYDEDNNPILRDQDGNIQWKF